MFHTDYIAPASLDEFLAVLHQHGENAKVIAGGTDLIPQMRLGKFTPRILLDPRRLPLAEIVETDEYIQLGPCFTHTQVLTTPLLKREFPALVEACQQVGGPPVRNRGTLAGNLANASPASDPALPLLVYDARILIARYTGERLIPLTDFYRGPGQTSLAIDELICGIRIPKLPPRRKTVFLKLGNRKAMAIAIASLALHLSLDESGQVIQARIALGSVAPIPLRAYHAEAILQSENFNEKNIQLATQAAQQASSPISDLRASAEYRSKMVAVLTRRALETVHYEIAQEITNG